MLNKGLRDKESIRIDNILRMLHSLVYVPKFWNADDISNIDEQLKGFGLSLQRTIDITEEEIIIHLQRLHLDWNQKEQFADFLVTFSKQNPFDFREKAIAVYNHIQMDSKTFSFEIFNKIATAKANL